MYTYLIRFAGNQRYNKPVVLESAKRYSEDKLEEILISSYNTAVNRRRFYDKNGNKIPTRNPEKVGTKQKFYSGIEHMVKTMGFKRISGQKIIETCINPHIDP